MNSTEAKILHDYYDDADDVYNPSMDNDVTTSKLGGCAIRVKYGCVGIGKRCPDEKKLPDRFEYVSSDVGDLYYGKVNRIMIHTFVLNNTESGKTYKVLIHRQRHHKCVVKSIDEVILMRL